MNRREFFSWVSVGALASSLPVVIAACSDKTAKNSTSQTPPPPPPGATSSGGFQTVGTVAELDKAGQIINKQLPTGPVLVIRNPADKNLIALNPTCPHKGCLVNWNVEEKVFDCPCHDSDFGLDGKQLKGPAKDPLKTYEVKIDGNNIAIKTT